VSTYSKYIGKKTEDLKFHESVDDDVDGMHESGAICIDKVENAGSYSGGALRTDTYELI
jgi:hypothetical protein